jgi:hypothetical protein
MTMYSQHIASTFSVHVPEDGGTMSLRNVGSHLPDCLLRNLQYESSLPRKPRILCIVQDTYQSQRVCRECSCLETVNQMLPNPLSTNVVSKNWLLLCTLFRIHFESCNYIVLIFRLVSPNFFVVFLWPKNAFYLSTYTKDLEITMQQQGCDAIQM